MSTNCCNFPFRWLLPKEAAMTAKEKKQAAHTASKCYIFHRMHLFSCAKNLETGWHYTKIVCFFSSTYSSLLCCLHFAPFIRAWWDFCLPWWVIFISSLKTFSLKMCQLCYDCYETAGKFFHALHTTYSLLPNCTYFYKKIMLGKRSTVLPFPYLTSYSPQVLIWNRVK